MKFQSLVQLFRDRPFFESAEVEAWFDEPHAQIQARLSRWVTEGRLLQLRRGKYLLAPGYRREEPSLYFISNYLYRPSYVSLYTALEFHGLIPEAVGVIQAVTSKHGKGWKTPVGIFGYHSIRADRFGGYREYSASTARPVALQKRFLMALPEKAILDLFYLYEGEWTEGRIEEVRFQNLEQMDATALLRRSGRLQSEKVARAVKRFLSIFFGTSVT